MPAPLHVTYDEPAGVLHVAVDGDIDISNGDDLRTTVVHEVGAHHPGHVVLDLDRSTYFGAAGVRALVEIRDAIDASIAVTCRPGSPARRVLDLFAGELQRAGLAIV